MSGTTGTIPLQPWVDDQLITKEILNGENSNIASLMDANGCGGHSDTDADAQIQTNPFPGSVISRAVSIAGELERLRYAIAQITGKTYWYQPATNGNNLSNVFITGEIRPFAGSSVPAGFLDCDGSAVSRTTYAPLFSAVGTTWGAGDGSTTFNLPDLRGRALLGAGAGSGLTARSLGATGGEETHALSVSETPAVSDPGHNHTQNAHTHTIAHKHATTTGIPGGSTGLVRTDHPNGVTSQAGTWLAWPLTGSSGSTAQNFENTSDSLTADSGSTTPTNNSNTTGVGLTGSGSAHNNMQPWACVKYIVKF